ncbi:MAG: L-gulono-1,4-lactone oxidase (EC [uncultured Caballeronia sp.]|nr:MAG: L-gulono-1,4-lactone oxidase (EC [uncultured Caballeronia sp.]
MCYSAAEAAWLASECFDDIVVAYPKVEPSSCGRGPFAQGEIDHAHGRQRDAG